MDAEMKAFAEKVKEMRAAQKNYFSTGANMPTVKQDWLKRSKALEKEVDDITARILGTAPAKLF